MKIVLLTILYKYSRCTDIEILRNNFFKDSGDQILRVSDTFVDSSRIFFVLLRNEIHPCNAFLPVMQYSASCNAHC